MRDTSGDEADGMDETIMPVDYSSAGQIIDDDLYSQMIAVLPEGACCTYPYPSRSIFGCSRCCSV